MWAEKEEGEGGGSAGASMSPTAARRRPAAARGGRGGAPAWRSTHARGVDAVLVGDDLPELGADLVAALAALHVDDLTHGGALRWGR